MHSSIIASGNPMAQMVESACNTRDLGSISGLGRSFGERNSNTHQYSCLEKFHGQRSLAVYSPWGLKESDMTEWLDILSFYSIMKYIYIEYIIARVTGNKARTKIYLFWIQIHLFSWIQIAPCEPDKHVLWTNLFTLIQFLM